MAGIQTTIQLQDQFTSTLYRVMDSVNLGVSVMEQLQQTMGSPIDMSAMESAKDVIQQGVSMAQQWDRAVQGMEAPLLTAEFSPIRQTTLQSALPDHLDIPVEPILPDLSQLSVPDSVEVFVEPRMEVAADPLPLQVPIEPDVPDPLVETPAAVSVPIEWESYDGLDVFTNTGMERFQSEVSQVHLKLDDLTQTQSRITQNASVLQVLSPQAVLEVQGVEQQMGELLQMIRRVEANPLNMGTEEANTKWERLRGQVSGVLQVQRDLDAAIQDMDLSSTNTAYLQLSQSIEDTKRYVRDSFSNLPPMEVPISWKTDSLPVFTGTGMERFQQEVQSTNQMLDTLHQTQNRIVGTAAQTGFFPVDAMADLEQMQTRLQAIGQKIEQIEQNPLTLGSDMASAELEQLRGQFDQATQGQQKLNRAVEQMDVQAANEAYLQFSQTISHTEKMLRDRAEIEVPIHWKVDSLPVFTGSGVERFQQEVQSANNMLNTLNQTQSKIAEIAAQTDLFPANAIADMNNMQSRLQAIQQRIQTIENNPLNMGTDTANAELEQLRGQFDQAIQGQQKLNRAVEQMDVQAANEAYLQFSQTISHTEKMLRDRATIEVPIHWKVDSLPVFTGSGVERFQQEVQSANQMLEQLSGTQNQIAQQSSNTTLFPPESFQSLNNLAARIDTVRGRIKQIEDQPVNLGTDTANAELEQLRGQLDRAGQAQQALNQAMQRMDVSAANAAYLQLSQIISGTEQYIRDNVDAEGQFQSVIQETGRLTQHTSNEFRGWQKAIILANQALGLIKGTLGQIGLFNLDGAFNRLDTMNRFQKTVTIMTGDANMASAALERLKDTTKGTAYGLDVAAKSTQNFLTRGMSLGAATDQVRVWADAVSFYGNGTNEQLENVIDAIGKIYSKGTVEQTQLDRLFDAGIGAAELYAKAVGRSVSEVKDDLTNRRISSADFIQTVTEALDSGVSAGAAKDAGSTWSATFANIGAAINRGWVDILTNLDAALASRGLPSAMEMISTFGQRVEDVLNNVGSAMGMVVDVAINIYEILSGVGGFFIENWSIISPLIYGVAAALAVYYGWQMLCAGATAVLAAKEAVLNAILSANPTMKIVLAMIALVAIIFAVCNAIAKMTGIANSGFGVMTGGIWVVIQFFKNLGAFILNIILGLINAFGALADNMMTAFSNAICSVQSWFYDLLSTALTVVGKICEALNRLPFVEFDYSGVTSAAEKYAAKAAEVLENKEEYENVGDAFQKGFHTFDAFQEGWVSDAFQAGASWGDEIAGRLTDVFHRNKELPNEGDDILDKYSNLLENTDLLSDTGNIDDTTKGISKSLDVAEEDLKYLRDIAEQEAINRFTTAEIKVEMGGITNQVSGNMDLDGMVDYLAEKLEETMQMTAAGVH